jgi:endonuclease YncB( thermonuclease family)
VRSHGRLLIGVFVRVLGSAAITLGLGLEGAAADVPSSPTREVIRGRVTKVVDGDTISVTSAEGEARIRLAEIDAPEMSQPHGAESRAALEALVFGKSVRVVVIDTDRYGRKVGGVFVGERYVSYEMVKMGHAWAYTKYSKSLSILDAEDAARAAGRGLWSLPVEDRDAPWTWRSRGRAADAPGRTGDESEETPFSCARKRSCKEMRSCAEARYHLIHCGGRSLDGDRDGVPCEHLCIE